MVAGSGSEDKFAVSCRELRFAVSCKELRFSINRLISCDSCATTSLESTNSDLRQSSSSSLACTSGAGRQTGAVGGGKQTVTGAGGGASDVVVGSTISGPIFSSIAFITGDICLTERERRG